MEGADLVLEVTCREPFLWKGKPAKGSKRVSSNFEWPEEPGKRRVVAMDYGVKYNILRSLESKGGAPSSSCRRQRIRKRSTGLILTVFS
jgi:carbamoyl-phosphate synthase small subunit